MCNSTCSVCLELMEVGWEGPRDNISLKEFNWSCDFEAYRLELRSSANFLWWAAICQRVALWIQMAQHGYIDSCSSEAIQVWPKETIVLEALQLHRFPRLACTSIEIESMACVISNFAVELLIYGEATCGYYMWFSSTPSFGPMGRRS